MARYRLVLLFVIVAAVALTVSGIVGLAQSAPIAAENKSRNFPNVVLVVIDALRADRVYAERNHVPVMPHLAQWTEGAVCFPHAVAACTWTRPSMASILTSLYVDTHQVYGPPLGLSDRLETTASFLKKAGYATFGLQTNGNLSPPLGFGQGFDTYDYLPGTVAQGVTDHALDMIQNVPQPFFLYAHYIDPHPMFTPPDSYRSLLGFPDPQLDPAERAIAEDFTAYFWDQVDYRMGIKSARDIPVLSPLGQEAVRTLYDGECRFADDNVGRLLEAIERDYPNTIIIVTANHGEHLFEHGYLGHGMTMYEEVLRVPLYIKGPGLEPRTIDSNVNTVSLLPTIAAFVGLPARPAWQGHNLLAFHNPLAPMFSYTRGAEPPRDLDLEMVQVDAMKLILNRRTGEPELYDIGADPREATNLAAQQPEQVDQLRALLDTHRQQNMRARGQVRPRTVHLDAAAVKELENLGYEQEKKGGP